MKTYFISYPAFLLLLTIVPVASAIPLVPGEVSIPIIEKESFVPVERINTYSLAINAEKSYFKIDKNPYDIAFIAPSPQSFPLINSPVEDVTPPPPTTQAFEPVTYKITGEVEIFDRYYENEFGILTETRISSLNIHSAFDNIDLSSKWFWNDNYELLYHYRDKSSFNSICACITSVGIGGPYIDGKFNKGELILNGGGLFSRNEDGIYGLDSSLDATNYISYHIEANAISSVPVPAAFYFFFTGLVGLVVNLATKKV